MDNKKDDVKNSFADDVKSIFKKVKSTLSKLDKKLDEAIGRENLTDNNKNSDKNDEN